MVLVKKENAFQLREHLYNKANESTYADPFKSAFLCFLGLSKNNLPSFDFAKLPVYQRCAIAGLGVVDETLPKKDVSRLLGQAAMIDSTPRPWVSDMFGVMAVKWLCEKMNDDQINQEFENWISGFLNRENFSADLNPVEKDIAAYVRHGDSATYASACVPLFLHFKKLQRLHDHKARLSLTESFMREFQAQAQQEASTALIGLMVYVFDQVNQDIAIVPPKGWNLEDLIGFLQHVPVGLKRWTWESKPRTKSSEPIKWKIENEYHVQNLLYVLLAPIFPDIGDEVNLSPLGQKNPRIDLYLPSLHTIIEVKYRKDNKKSFAMLIGEIAEDASLYRADPKYKDAQIISFLWDRTRSTQEHAKFKEGVLTINGIDGCVIVNAPSTMDNH